MKNRCLYCYRILTEGETDFHAACSKKIFGVADAPLLPYTEEQMAELAGKVIQSQTTITGVQAKLSLHLASAEKPYLPGKFTIVGLWGGFILKPPTTHYKQLPEVEDLSMHLAEIAGIQVVPHSLIRLASGNLAYVTKRIDRFKKQKLHMEDMCQLTERLTEHKYQGSHEQIAKAIMRYSTTPGLDLVNFFEMVVFSFLIGNADMHLKNYSLLYQIDRGPVLSPAYDMVATALVNQADDEDLALTLNGKKKKIKKQDFVAAMTTMKLDAKQQENIFKKMERALPKWLEFIDLSFLDKDFKAGYKAIITERFDRIS